MFFFAPSAARHLAQSRDKQKHSHKYSPSTKAKQRKTAKQHPRATPIPLARIGVPRKKRQKTRAIQCQRGGKPAQRTYIHKADPNCKKTCDTSRFVRVILARGHANLLCIVPILSDPRRESNMSPNVCSVDEND